MRSGDDARCLRMAALAVLQEALSRDECVCAFVARPLMTAQDLQSG